MLQLEPLFLHQREDDWAGILVALFCTRGFRTLNDDERPGD